MYSPKLLLATFVSTVAYLGLAVWGWGGPKGFFSHPALTALTVITIILSGVALFSEGNLSPGIREDRSNRWVIPCFVLIGLLVGYLPAYYDRKDIWTFGGNTVRWLGVVLFASGSTLRILPVFLLGKRFSGLVAIQSGHKLVTTGLYSVMRNPSYLGLVVGMAGWALAFRSGVGLLLTALMIPLLMARIRSEEALLRSEFGAEYEAYCQRTPRWIPLLSWWHRQPN